MRRWVGTLMCVAGCGRFWFDFSSSVSDGGDDGCNPAGRFSGDVSSDVSSDGASDGATARPNVAFVTRGVYSGALGGLSGADGICQTAAISAGLPGTFVAWLSTSTVNARDRFAASHGWIGTNG